MPATATPVFTISDVTSKLLRNFVGIQNSVLLQPGKQQATVASGKSLFAIAQLPDDWPQETGIYDLNTFLGTLSLFSKPTVAFDTDKGVMVIQAGASKVKYRMSDPSTILTPPPDEPGNKLKTDNPGVTFTLSDKSLGQLNKSCAVLGLMSATGQVVIDASGGAVVVRGRDEKNPTAHSFEIEIPEKEVTFHQPNFTKKLVVKTEYMAMLLDGGYDISLSDRKYGYFKHQTEPVAYFIVGQSTQA